MRDPVKLLPVPRRGTGKAAAAPEPRLPKNYRLLWDVLKAVGPGKHLTAGDVFVRARERQPRLGYSTVHRGLARLCRLGLIMKIDVPGLEAVTYETTAPRHAHFWCQSCGSISDIEFTLSKKVRGELAARRGIEIDGEALTLTGRCAECVAATKAP